MERQHKLDYYICAMENNLSRSSRTIIKGVVDSTVSKSKYKPKSEISESTVLKLLAKSNVISYLNKLYDIKEEKFKNAEEFKALVFDMSNNINKGIIKEDETFYRTHEINNPEYGCQLNKIESLMDMFYEWGFEVFNKSLSYKEVFQNCALLEKIIDKNIHPLKDGCGRLAKTLSSFLSMRNDAPIKVYPTQKEYHSAKGKQLTGKDMFNPNLSQEFITFYANLTNFKV